MLAPLVIVFPKQTWALLVSHCGKLLLSIYLNGSATCIYVKGSATHGSVVGLKLCIISPQISEELESEYKSLHCCLHQEIIEAWLWKILSAELNKNVFSDTAQKLQH